MPVTLGVKLYNFSVPGVENPQEPGLQSPEPLRVAVVDAPQVIVVMAVQGSAAPGQLVHCTTPVWQLPSVPQPAVVL